MKRARIIQIWIIFAAVMITGIALLSMTFAGRRQAGISGVENAVSSAMEPAVSASYSTAANIREFFRRLFSMRAVDQEYQQLKQRVIELELEHQWAMELQRENESLTGLLGYKERNPEYQYVHAEIIARDPGSWFLEFTINRGSDDGIATDMAVVSKDGLVGRIIEVSDKTSKVLAMIDSRSATASVIERSRDMGIVKGAVSSDSADALVHIYYLPIDADLVPGDKVLTSSQGGIYPKGILIGEVIEVVIQEGKDRYAVVRPAVDFGHLEHLLIITGDTPIAELTEIREETEQQNPEEQEAGEQQDDGREG